MPSRKTVVFHILSEEWEHCHQIFSIIEPAVQTSQGKMMSEIIHTNFSWTLPHQIRTGPCSIEGRIYCFSRYRSAICRWKEVPCLSLSDQTGRSQHRLYPDVDASIQLHSKKELIEQFISQVNVDSSIGSDWRRFVSVGEAADLTEIISTENPKPVETQKFTANAFRDGIIKTTGTDIDRLMPPASTFRWWEQSSKKAGRN